MFASKAAKLIVFVDPKFTAEGFFVSLSFSVCIMRMGRHRTVVGRVTVQGHGESCYYWSPQVEMLFLSVTLVQGRYKEGCTCAVTRQDRHLGIWGSTLVLPEHSAVNLGKSLDMKSCSHSSWWESCHGIQSFNKQKWKMSPVWHQRGSALRPKLSLAVMVGGPLAHQLHMEQGIRAI